MSARGELDGGNTYAAIRQMVPQDAAELVGILQESPEASLWSQDGILGSVESGMALVAERDGHAVGFLIGRAVAGEFEILNMAVARAHRRRGIAGRLVGEAIIWSSKAGAMQAHLEVRASNEAAISLYVRHGFRPSGRRERYYQHPSEDAIQLTRDAKGTT